MYFVCFPQNFQKSDSKFFLCQNRKFGAFDWWADYICATFNFRCEEAAKVFCKMCQKLYLSAPFEFRLSIYNSCTLWTPTVVPFKICNCWQKKMGTTVGPLVFNKIVFFEKNLNFFVTIFKKWNCFNFSLCTKEDPFVFVGRTKS